MSFYLRQRWYDPRLQFNASLGVDALELDPKLMDRIWVPDIYIINEKTAKFHTVTVPNKMMYIYPDGLVLYSARSVWTLANDVYVCWRMATHANVCLRILTYVYVF